MPTRVEFVGRIHEEVRRSRPLFAGAVSARPARPAEAADIVRRELAERWPSTLAGFRREFERVGGTFHRVATAADVPALVATIARERDARRLVAWHADAMGVDWTAALSAAGLEVRTMPAGAAADEPHARALRETITAAEIGLTGADLAVAETGSLVLLSGAGRPRSTSLLPAYHVAVFDGRALVESLAQVGVILESWHGAGDPAWRGGVVAFITGPSRTADIELTLTRGVHGPREVHAVFVEGGLRG